MSCKLPKQRGSLIKRPLVSKKGTKGQQLFVPLVLDVPLAPFNLKKIYLNLIKHLQRLCYNNSLNANNLNIKTT
jgi:hypothetical protein